MRSGRAFPLPAVLPLLLEDAIEHGEDGLLLGFGEAADALELALELGGGPALAGVGAGDAQEDVGGTANRAARRERRATGSLRLPTSGCAISRKEYLRCR